MVALEQLAWTYFDQGSMVPKESPTGGLIKNTQTFIKRGKERLKLSSSPV